MIHAHNVSKTYSHTSNSVTVFENINLTIDDAKVHAITGVSGSGKTTLLYLLSGLDSPTTGSITFNGLDLHTFTPQQYKEFQKSISFVFQFPHLIAELSVQENIMLSACTIGISHTNTHAYANELLMHVGLEGLAHRWPHELSGGQKQRVALARALCSKPRFLFADEPTGSLDAHTGKEIWHVLRYCAHTFGISIVLTSHDPHVKEYADCIVEIKNGQLHEKK